ncbi:hypothetical protein Hamer_G008765 [Homarus americanus]|uniref:Uncharacterized protein n=1 Tax=Homarus americanus TaxID=6706 RepID=A0A8J5MNQ3_HOMAM|nr:hypothetical protein Hamer_G008765 [Homarus americanus]
MSWTCKSSLLNQIFPSWSNPIIFVVHTLDLL